MNDSNTIEQKDDAWDEQLDTVAKVLDASSILVAVRIRPLGVNLHANKGTEADNVRCLQMESKSQLAIAPAVSAVNPFPETKRFSYDLVLGEDTPQKKVYALTAERVLEKALQGYNGCIFAYGQTGSGKTHTMQGAEDQPGVIPRICRDLFKVAHEQRNKKSTQVFITYVELYQEEVRDLLSDESNAETRGRRPSIREDSGEGGKGVFLENVQRVQCLEYADIEMATQDGQKRRAMGTTSMNENSSRSHAVLTIEIERQDIGDPLSKTLSKLHLIDLAGSERAKSTGARGERLKEGALINQSLSALGNVINALTMKTRSHIPFRDSKLTRLLQGSLGGNSLTVMICNVSPGQINHNETLSSLRFADRAKRIQNKATINIDPMSAEIAKLRRENDLLKQALGHVRGGRQILHVIAHAMKEKEGEDVDFSKLTSLFPGDLEDEEKGELSRTNSLHSIGTGSCATPSPPMSPRSMGDFDTDHITDLGQVAANVVQTNTPSKERKGVHTGVNTEQIEQHKPASTTDGAQEKRLPWSKWKKKRTKKFRIRCPMM